MSSHDPDTDDGAPTRPSVPANVLVEASNEQAWRVKVGAVGVAIGALFIAAIMTVVSLVGANGDADEQVVSTVPPAADVVATQADEPALPSDVSADANDGDDDRTVIVVNDDGDDEITTRPADAPRTATIVTDAPADTNDSDDDGTNLLGGDDPEDKRMPDVVCRGLQAAQDEIQDRGVFGSKSEDATGEGRRQLWDRNWIVVDQDPAAGEKIGEFDAVLYVVKTDEPHDC